MATTARPRLYRLDFSASHTMATGMINTALTAITVAVVAHLATTTGATSQTQANLAIGALTIGGVILTLMWGAFSRRSIPGATITVRLACWVGAGIWSGMLASTDWSLENAVTYGAVLAVGTATLGFLGWLRSPLDTTDTAADQADQAAHQEERYQQLLRDDLAAQWRDRIARITRIPVEEIKIPGIEDFPTRAPDGRRVGFTLEVHLPAGGHSWETIHRAQQRIMNDADLAPGCDIATRMGRTRRIALVDVTEVNILREEVLYPTDYSPLSVYDPIPAMVSRAGAVTGPELREKNCAIFGEGGSGKSNTAQVFGACVARMSDALLCDIDVTGVRLSMPLIRAYLEGRAKNPAVWWVASDKPEANLLLRALDRAAIARNNGCNDLKLAAGDDKVPISPQTPQFLLRCDEIKHLVSIGADKNLSDGVRRITDDHRDPGFRALLFGLRGTNDIIAQGVQAQMQGIGVLKAQSRAEYTAAFGGQATGISPQDAPYPGCIQMRMDSAGQIQPYHVYRLVGKQIDDIAVAVSDYQPRVDELTWLALNGRDANGNPMPGLLPGELDCCATRWDRLRAKLGYASASSDQPTTQHTPKTFEQATQDLADATRRAEKRIEEIRQQQEEDARRKDELKDQISGFDIDGELRRIFGHAVDTTSDPMEGFKIDTTGTSPETTIQLPADPPADPPVDTYAVTAEIVEAAGTAGIEMSMIHVRLAERGISVDRATVHKWLKAMTGPTGAYRERIEWRPDRPEGRNGRWYANDENGK